MESIVTDFHILTSIGAGLFAMSFIRGAQGHLRQSIWMAALSALMGTLGALDGGALAGAGVDQLFVIGANLILAVLSVAVSRNLFLSARSSD